MVDPSATVTIGGKSYPTFNDEHFSKLREFFGVSLEEATDGFLFDLKSNGGNMAEGGGKGGNLMGFTSNRQLIIKELNKTDHNTMLKVAGDYKDHMMSEDGSLLCKVLAHFYHPDTKSVWRLVSCLPCDLLALRLVSSLPTHPSHPSTSMPSTIISSRTPHPIRKTEKGATTW